jgi:DNA-binding beta-propeller fold protein YncE
MKQLATVVIGVALLGAAGCGGVRPVGSHRRDPAPKVRRAPAHRRAAPLQALVTAQTENRLLVVALPSGRVVQRIRVPAGSDYVDAEPGVVVVVSSDPGAVTLLNRRSLRVVKVIRGFSAPHIPAISPDGRYAYVTDDGSGELAVIGLSNHHLLGWVFVGAGAHHLAFSPDEHQVWVALGQTAQSITILRALDPGHPHVAGSFHPPFMAHDLLFSPGGKQVWITSADTDYVGVFSARTRRLLFRVPAGAPPQHLVFANGSAYITSGYGSSIEEVNLFTGRVVRRTGAPYGSFDLDAAGGYVATASLLRGTLAIYNKQLRLIRIRQLAPSTEDVALSRPPGHA